MLNSDDPHAPLPPDHPVEDELAQALPDRRTTLPALLRRWALHMIPLILLGGAVYVLWREFQHLSFAEVAAAMAAWGPEAIAAALALSAFSFFLMGVVEQLGLRWMGVRISWLRAMRGSFLANAIAHSLGANLLVSGAVRARLYDRHGVNLSQVAGATLFGGVSFAVGLAALGGMGLLLSGPQELAASAIPESLARGLGFVLLSGAAGYIALCALRREPLHAFNRSFALPSVRAALGQLVIGIADNGVAAAIIWILLPGGAVSYPTFVGAYAVACVAGLASTVPAGAGVFESSLATLLPGPEAAHLAAAFLGYRLAYYLLPLVIAVAALAVDALRHPRRA
ncbi:MAG: lysylphosphatidylglycerol synthase domain-containing protein [Phenylobacterium sp.]